MRISWSDLESIQSRGRWWLVGSAWSGSGPINKPNQKSDIGVQGNEIITLARSHKMNTETRRSIFSIIITSEVTKKNF